MNSTKPALKSFEFIKIIFFLSGIFALFAQVILVREFIAVFYGNELIIATVTAVWMLAVFAGNRFAAIFLKKNLKVLLTVMLASIFITPFALLVLKLITSTILTTNNVIAPFKTILTTAFFTVLPVGILNGFLFSIGSGMAHQDKELNAVAFYRSETLGLLVGGLIFTFIFARNFTNFASLIYLTNAILITTCILSFIHFNTKIRFIFLLLPTALIVLPSTATISAYESLSFKNEKLIKTVPSVYGTIAITENKKQHNFYLNNFYKGCSDDKLNSGLNAHVPLCAVKNKSTLLYIGSLYDETLAQLLTDKAVLKIYVPVSDFAVLETIKPYLSEKQQLALTDKRVILLKESERVFLKNTDEKFSCVLINIGKPQTGITNRFYTLEFFKMLKKRLSADAVLVIKFKQNKTYVLPEDACLLLSIAKTLKQSFAVTKNYLSDMTIMCAAQTDVLPKNSDEAARNLKTDITPKGYLNQNMIKDIFGKKAEINFKEATKVTEEIKINTDLNPAAYYFNLQKQTALYTGKKISHAFINMSAKSWFIISCILAALFTPRKKADINATVLYSMTCLSFACITLLLCLIYSLHATYGTVYVHISLLTAVFMGGIYRGTTYAQIAVSLPNQNVHTFLLRLIGIKITIILFVGFLAVMFKLFTLFLPPKLLQMLLWLLLTFYLGNFNGYAFGLVSKIREMLPHKDKDLTGGIYAADILGGSFGAFLCGMVFIPRLGIYQTCAVAVSFVFFSLIFALSGHKYLKNS